MPVRSLDIAVVQRLQNGWASESPAGLLARADWIKMCRTDSLFLTITLPYGVWEQWSGLSTSPQAEKHSQWNAPMGYSWLGLTPFLTLTVVLLFLRNKILAQSSRWLCAIFSSLSKTRRLAPFGKRKSRNIQLLVHLYAHLVRSSAFCIPFITLGNYRIMNLKYNLHWVECKVSSRIAL